MQGQIEKVGKECEGGEEKTLMGCLSLSVESLSKSWQSGCECVCVSFTSLCAPPVSKQTLIISDLGMTHHMPAPHAPSDFYSPVSRFPKAPTTAPQPSYKFMHLCSSPHHAPPPSRCSFVSFCTQVSPSHLYFSTRSLLLKDRVRWRSVISDSLNHTKTMSDANISPQWANGGSVSVT